MTVSLDFPRLFETFKSQKLSYFLWKRKIIEVHNIYESQSRPEIPNNYNNF